jgi:hypothetical protein
MGVVIEICAKHQRGREWIYVTDMYSKVDAALGNKKGSLLNHGRYRRKGRGKRWIRMAENGCHRIYSSTVTVTAGVHF